MVSHVRWWLFLGLLFARVDGVPGATPATRPNFLVILADDLGFSDLGCYGGELRTPQLDGLARDGLRFSQFYNTARCWPTRAALLTGYYPQAIRRDALPGVEGGGAAGRRPGWARLLPEYLKPLGYRAYHSGKWHLDGPRLGNGFDRSYSLEDHDRNFGPRNHSEDDLALPAVGPGTNYYSTTAIAEHALRCLRDHAERFPGQPFFHYLAFTVPHFPLQAPAADIARCRERYQAGWDVLREERTRQVRALGLVRAPLPALEPDIVPPWNLSEAALGERIGPGEAGRAVPWRQLAPEQREFQAEKMAIHAAMIERMDFEIGRVLEQIRGMGAWDNTVVVFLSDNGASAEQIIRGDGHDRAAAPGSAGTFLGLGPGWSSAANAPFRLHKSWVHEGGIRTPLIVHWPARIRRPGRIQSEVGHVVDLAPTLLELAGGTWPERIAATAVPPSHGRSLASLWQKGHLGKPGSEPSPVWWWYHEGHRALRRGDWKLVQSPRPGAGQDARWELYDLRRDPNEQRDVADRHPARVRELAETWNRRAEEFRALANGPSNATTITRLVSP